MDDLISRQAVIEINRSYHGQMPNEVNHRIWKEINELPSTQPDLDEVYAHAETEAEARYHAQQRWIPCSERLPKEEGWYITTIENEKTGRRIIENDLFAIGIAEAHGNTPYKFCKDGHRQKTIAWMPMPEPYREEGD